MHFSFYKKEIRYNISDSSGKSASELCVCNQIKIRTETCFYHSVTFIKNSVSKAANSLQVLL